ncbi:MAG: hypothetical protein CVU51_08480 [Deltaproteobacteria bacterium HGW-Deltaproteobacteria-1]|jgi:hypothetical protein|nr:MAG: hypothetical protein CVU51_08480 [Deltaproteobacteria bacterium HGW-Deltaproteobacteria-1]
MCLLLFPVSAKTFSCYENALYGLPKSCFPFRLQGWGKKRVAVLQKELQDLIIIPPHDLFDHKAQLVGPFLEDGI